MNTQMNIRHHSARHVAAIREELLDLHDAVYADTGDPLADRASFAPFLDHWASLDGFACTAARTRMGALVGYAYGAPLTAGASWWEGITPPLDAAAAVEDGTRTFAVSELLVAEDWRGTGTARRLHDILLDGRPEQRSTLLTHADHHKVVALYETWGYHRLGECVPFDGAPRLIAMLRPYRTRCESTRTESAFSRADHDRAVEKGHPMTPEAPQWFKSSYSDNGGTCVEAATNLVASHDTVPVRDSKNPDGPVLGFETAAWSAFVSAIKRGEFA